MVGLVGIEERKQRARVDDHRSPPDVQLWFHC
jgi:hypothetical protein